MDNKTKEYYTIDVMHIMKTLWNRAWIIALVGFLSAAIGFSFSAFVIKPTYSSSIMLYVNNNSFSLGNTDFSISSSQLTAAQSLVRTYSEILNNRTTLERVIDKTDAPYTYKELSKMIEAAPSNDTEIMRVTVTSEDPYEAARIANGIAEVLPMRVSEIIDGATMEVVDSAIPELEKEI
jgi:capsular polysaccharide biosynthesis protein